MSLATTLGLKKAPARSNTQPASISGDDANLLGRGLTQMIDAPANAVLDTVLLIVSENIAEQNDSDIALILGTVLVDDRPFQEHIDQQTHLQIMVRSYAQDPHVGLPMGQSIFRRLLGERFDQSQMTSTSFAQRHGKSGVIIAQWRSKTPAVEGAAQKRQTVQASAQSTVPMPASHEVNENAMAHWSWWAERSLLKEHAS